MLLKETLVSLHCSSTSASLAASSFCAFARCVLPALVNQRSVYRLASHVLARLSCVDVSVRCSSLKTGMVTELGSFCSRIPHFQTVPAAPVELISDMPSEWERAAELSARSSEIHDPGGLAQ